MGTDQHPSYLDRINVSNARLAGMQEDGNMTDVEWSAGISLFYVGYIISQVPANIVIAKGKPRILLPCVMLGWSCVTIAMPAITSPAGFMVCRFLVGLTEGSHDLILRLLRSLTLFRSFLTRCCSSYFVVVHKARITFAHGYLARWQHRFQCHLGLSCRRHLGEHGQHRRSSRMAMVLHSRR